jgi:hypothetical protein
VPLQYLSVNTDKNILLIYTEWIIVGKEGMKKKNEKYDDLSFTPIKIPTGFKIPIATPMN